MALALRKLSKAYQDRLDRKPTLAEILYALEIVILSAPEAYLSDAETINAQTVFVKYESEEPRASASDFA